jgi:ABC-type transport system involved in multi-copper enzyme maturation permease subunit
MRIHLLLTCAACLYLGIGLTVMEIGIKAGISLVACITIWITSVVFFIVIVLTSMDKIKGVLYNKKSNDTSI